MCLTSHLRIAASLLNTSSILKAIKLEVMLNKYLKEFMT